MPPYKINKDPSIASSGNQVSFYFIFLKFVFQFIDKFVKI